MQKVVTLNTCCDVACLTFQLPHITTVSFQCLQRLKECNKPSVRCKSFAIHVLVWWHFQVGWASGLQLVFCWDNINSQRYVWIIQLKMSFFGFPKVKWLRLTGEVDRCVRFSCQIFSGCQSLKSVNFWQTYSKKVKVGRFGDSVYYWWTARVFVKCLNSSVTRVATMHSWYAVPSWSSLANEFRSFICWSCPRSQRIW